MQFKKNLPFFKKTASFAIIFTLCCGIMFTGAPANVAHAVTEDELNEKIAAIKEENKKIQQQIESTEGLISENEELKQLVFQKLEGQKTEIDLLNNRIYEKEQEIADKQSNIDETVQLIADKQKSIEDMNDQISSLETENTDNITKFGDIIASAYMNEDRDMVSLLMGATDFYDLLVMSEILQNTGERNEEFMNDLMSSIDDLENMKVTVGDEIAACEEYEKKLTDERTDLENQKAVLEDERAESQSLSDQYQSDYSTYKSYVQSYETQKSNLEYQQQVNANEVADFEKQLEALIKAAQNKDKVYVEGDWAWPLDHGYHMITTYFGYDAWRGGNHSGIDIGDGGIGGANIYAAKDGTVIKAVTAYTAGYSYGMYIVIDHGGGYTTLYGHCSAIYVSVGQEVKQGDAIGAVGSTGWSTGNHLHFEVRYDGIAQDPFGYVQKFW